MDLRPVEPDARILIIDDSETSASQLARLLQKAGYAVCITVTDPAVALERFCKISPDIVLLDLHMDPISGIEVLHGFNALMDEGTRPPVLVMTGDTTPEAKHEALAAGATDFLSKPFDHVEVLLRIRHMLAARSRFRQSQAYSRRLEEQVRQRIVETRQLELALAELQESHR
jgi:putative two-component system response regulator